MIDKNEVGLSPTNSAIGNDHGEKPTTGFVTEADRKKEFALHGRDLDAPVQYLTLGDEKYMLRFNNKAARIAEDVYESIYGKPEIGYYAIIDEAAHSKHRAMQAIYYGALLAGGATMDWDTFDEKFTLSSIDGVADIIMKALSESLPPADESAPNADSQPQSDGPGAG